jgi:hypothetical protein
MRQRYPIAKRGFAGSKRGRPFAASFAKLPPVLVFGSAATTFTVGLLVTFLGIGVIANVLIGYAVVQVLGERQQNEEHRSRRAGEG